MVRYLQITIFACLISVSGLNLAAPGSSQATPVEPHFEMDRIAEFAKKVERTLARHRAHVALISRTGRSDDELPEGIKYTHVGIAVYSMITLEDGTTQPGYAIYNLYQRLDRLNKSELVQDFPLQFYSGAFKLKSGIIIPKPELQQRLLEVVQSPVYEKLHNPSYSAIANPFNHQRQNCTEFVLNVVQSALYQTDDIGEIKSSIKAYFEPYDIPHSPISVFLGALFSKELAASDHGRKYQTATYTTIANYMEKYALADQIFEISL